MSSETFDRLCRDGTIIETKGLRPAVIEHTDSAGRIRMTKFWYPRSAFSSDRFRPYAWRFVAATEELQRRRIRAPKIVACGLLTDQPKTRWVTYEKLSGTPLRHVSQDNPQDVDIDRLARFIQTLHDTGIYFRALNLGNILICSDNGYGLIDVADIRFLESLPRYLRIRNLGSFCAQPGDSAYLHIGPAHAIVTAYCEAVGFDPLEVLAKVDRDVQRRRNKMTRIRRRRGLPALKIGEYPSDRERNA